MNKRIARWRTLTTVLGWVLIALGVLAFAGSTGATIALVTAGMSLLLTGALLSWMNDILGKTHRLLEEQKMTNRLLKSIRAAAAGGRGAQTPPPIGGQAPEEENEEDEE